MSQPNKHYNVPRKQKADMKVMLRALVSGYLLFLAWKLVSSSGPEFPRAARYLAGLVFTAGAAAFGWFTWKSYRAGLKDAELTPEEEEELRQQEEDT